MYDKEHQKSQNRGKPGQQYPKSNFLSTFETYFVEFPRTVADLNLGVFTKIFQI